MNIFFKPLCEQNLTLLENWISAPHVKEYWDRGDDWDVVASRYRDKINSEMVRPFIIYLDSNPIGYIQYYWASKVGNDWWQGYGEDVVGVDQFIGEVEFVGKGIGTKMIQQFVEMLFTNSQINRIISDPEPRNKRAIRCYEKVGFNSIGEMETPDGLSLLMEVKRSDWD